MILLIRALLATQIVLFASAAAVHAGVIGSRPDPAAATTETVIGVALLAGLAMSFRKPAETRAAALASQGFALLGTLIGFSLVVFVGPTHTFDVAVHGSMLVLLAVGLLVSWRQDPSVEHS